MNSFNLSAMLSEIANVTPSCLIVIVAGNWVRYDYLLRSGGY